MHDKVVFEPKIIKHAKTEHVCFGCGEKIAKNQLYIRLAGIGEDGKFQSTKICFLCSFLQTLDERKTEIKQNQFSDLFIPNCLRKVKKEFLKNPDATFKKYKAMKEAEFAARPEEPPQPPSPPPMIKSLVVKKKDYQKLIFHFPVGTYIPSQFQKGAELTIRSGVTGPRRKTIIRGAWVISGHLYGRNERQIAVLTAR